MPLPYAAYQTLIEEGTLAADPAQDTIAKRLDELARELDGYSPSRRRWLRRAPPQAPKGLYLWGGVGVGKSLLMDLFFEGAPVDAKRRVHFHAFMQEVHSFIADWRSMDDRARSKDPARAREASLDDPIPHAAKAIFQEAHLLCFDEFQVTDITDAMLLGRLFRELFARGVVVVATSNRHPDDLYKDGINRQLFLPAIQLLKEKLETHELVAAKDYRLDRLDNERFYFAPLGAAADQGMDRLWEALTAGGTVRPERLSVQGRIVQIPRTSRGNARGTFAHFCDQPLGPADYLAIAASYPTLFLDRIPKMSPAKRDVAKRFVTLVDALYEAKCKLICSADAAPEDLYPAGDGAFEFERTASRLREMQSRTYLEQEHVATQGPQDALAG